jgi:hypothetical protein
MASYSNDARDLSFLHSFDNFNIKRTLLGINGIKRDMWQFDCFLFSLVLLNKIHACSR